MSTDETSSFLFDLPTPLDFSVRLSAAYWDIIIRIKHPIMTDRLSDVQATLTEPDEIRRSLSDSNVYLFYKLERRGRWICALAKRLNGDGFLITTYPTDAIKEGETIWQK
jgi:hypothetical protein